MKSVGEAMAIGRTFKESLQKCRRSLERAGRGVYAASTQANQPAQKFSNVLANPHAEAG